MVNLKCKRLQIDEVWSYTYCKQAQVSRAKKKREGNGDTWTWIAIDDKTKLIPDFHVGARTTEVAKSFFERLAPRLAHKVQITTDSLKCYIEAVENGFGCNADYAQLHKMYGTKVGPKSRTAEARYSPAPCIGIRKKIISGQPDLAHVSTQLRPASKPHPPHEQPATDPLDECVFKEAGQPHFSAWGFTSCIITSAAFIRRCA